MRIWSQLLLIVISSLLAVNVYAEVAADDVGSTEISTQPVVNTLGVGTEGYGSPVMSDHVRLWDINSIRSGYFHPFLSVGGYHTDNLFNTPSKEKSDWVAVITPGIWIARPASRQKMVDINTINTAPGGLALSRFETETERRLQTYALYRADIMEHDKYTDENRVDHQAEGMIKLSLRGGLSLELIDVFEINHDPYGTGGTPDRKLDKYTSNLFNATLAYKLSPKLRLRVDYGNYYLDYDADRNEYRNREDNSLDAYIFYTLTPKTSIFVQSEYIWIDYDKDLNSDSDENNYYIGLEMRASAKTRGRLKVGYGNKDYDESGLDDRDEWLAEGQFSYFFTPKTSIYVRGVRRVYETDTLGATDILTHRIRLGYRQRFTAKFRGEASVHYTDNEYDGKVTIDGLTKEREDEVYGFSTSVGFSPRPWLNLSLGYEYIDRDSNFDTEEYRTNTVFMRVTAAL
jgi:hypothetical protein